MLAVTDETYLISVSALPVRLEWSVLLHVTVRFGLLVFGFTLAVSFAYFVPITLVALDEAYVSHLIHTY